jgi:putative NADH-flavin reductase
MNILILGATGLTGQHLVRQALEEGHIITAIVRNKAALTVSHAHLSIHTVDILNEFDLTREILNKDAVLSALGSGKNLHSDIISKAMPVLIGAMDHAHVRRLIFLSSFGVGETRKQAPLFGRIIFRLLLNHILLDKTKADFELKNSDLNFTLVYPTSLTNGKKTGKYRVGEKLSLPFFPRISRADVSDFMLSQLNDSRWIRKTAVVSY